MEGSHWIAQVLPIHSSQDAEGYTYRVPEALFPELKVGQLVSIPLRGEITE